MSTSNDNKDAFDNDVDMTVELNLDCGKVMCSIVTILTVNDSDYIVLLPEKNPLCEEGQVWFYRYKENPDNPNEEPELSYISSDEEYDAVEDAYEEFVDTSEFESLD